jgi:hypothetical protein
LEAERIQRAEAFLREAVFCSRARQAAIVGLAPPRVEAASTPGTCGLGARAAIELDLSARGTELFEALWPRGAVPHDLEHVQECMRLWVTRQDALDRKRNHFLRDFRRVHGFDRTAYDPATLESFEQGLERVNAEENASLHQAAEELLV